MDTLEFVVAAMGMAGTGGVAGAVAAVYGHRVSRRNGVEQGYGRLTDDLQEERVRLDARYEAVSAQLAEANQRLIAAMAEAARLREERERFRAQLAEAQRQFAEAQTQLMEAQQQMAEGGRQLADALQMAENLRAETVTMREEMADLRAQLNRDAAARAAAGS